MTDVALRYQFLRMNLEGVAWEALVLARSRTLRSWKQSQLHLLRSLHDQMMAASERCCCV